jgi:uncharacterized membrane protein
VTPGDERGLHRAFEISVLLKGAHAVIEIAGGLFLLLESTHGLSRLVFELTEPLAALHAGDRVAAYLRHAAEAVSLDTKTFAALYLLLHGVIKLGLVVGLLREKAWAYPAAIVAFGGFIAYQLYRYTFTHSLTLIVITVFDAIVLALIWHEWRYRKRAAAMPPT